MDNKIRVLGIAPYASMKMLMTSVAKQFPEIELTAYVGDLGEGAQIVTESTSRYDIIISRGGTAQLIRKLSSIPVLDIPISVYDILRTVKLANNYGQKYNIVGFPSITEPTQLLCDLMQYKIKPVTIHSPEETMNALKKLRDEGYKMFLGDKVVTHYAAQMGLNSLLITSSMESINAAFRQIIEFFQNFADIRGKLDVMCSSFKGNNFSSIILDEYGDTIFSNFSIDDLETLTAVTNRLKADAEKCMRVEKKKFFVTVRGQTFSIHSYSYSDYDKKYVSFQIWNQGKTNSGNYKEIKILSSSDLAIPDVLFESLKSNRELISKIEPQEQYSISTVLLGEHGTEKSYFAKLIHSQSRFKNNPFFDIDCETMSLKTWNYLMDSYNSPFLDSHNTLYLRRIDCLDEEKIKQLIKIILESNICKRNKTIFSFDTVSDGQNSDKISYFINKFSCSTMSLSPLRENVEAIPDIANLYLNSLNISLGKDLVGLEPEALDIMQNYQWPYNLVQFKRVLKEVALVTDGAYITSSSIVKSLSKEAYYSDMYTIPEVNLSLNKDGDKKTLKQITKEVIMLVLNQNNGNQSLTAKQLGISRSTLWRYIS